MGWENEDVGMDMGNIWLGEQVWGLGMGEWNGAMENGNENGDGGMGMREWG